jgi:hypothetical protein
MSHYRYRIQVGDQYTYRNDSFALDRLVEELLDKGLGYEGNEAKLGRLLRKAQGHPPEPEPPEPKPVLAEDIRITVEKVPPPPRPKKQPWRKAEGN